MPWKKVRVSPDQHKILGRLNKVSDKHFDGEAFTLGQAKDAMKPHEYYQLLAMGPTFSNSRNQRKAFNSYIRATTPEELRDEQNRKELLPLLKNKVKGHHLYYFGNKIATLDCFGDTTYQFDDGCLSQRFLFENITSGRKMAKGANEAINAYKFIAKILKLKGWNKAIPLKNFSNKAVNEAVEDGLVIHEYGNMLRDFTVGDIGSASLSLFLTVMENTNRFKTSADLLGLGIYILKNHGAFIDGVEWTASKIWKNKRINSETKTTTTPEPGDKPEITTEPVVMPETTTDSTETTLTPESEAKTDCRREWSEWHNTFMDICTAEFDQTFEYSGSLSKEEYTTEKTENNHQTRDRFELSYKTDESTLKPFLPSITTETIPGGFVQFSVSTSGLNDPTWEFTFFDDSYVESRRRCLNKSRSEGNLLSFDDVEEIIKNDNSGGASFVNGEYNGPGDNALYRINLYGNDAKTVDVVKSSAISSLPESEDFYGSGSLQWHCTKAISPDTRGYTFELIPMA